MVSFEWAAVVIVCLVTYGALGTFFSATSYCPMLGPILLHVHAMMIRLEIRENKISYIRFIMVVSGGGLEG